MATAQGQDIIRCRLCSNPVEHHCNLCHVDLCLSCIPKHMADKSRRHEVVEYTFRKEHTVILPLCLTHKKYQCETYCIHCQIPICIQCLMGSHKKHEFTDISHILQEHKQQIKSDIEELENVISPRYRKIDLTTTTAVFDEVLSAIEEQEDKICKAVHEAGSSLKNEVTNKKNEAIRKCKEKQSLVEKEIDQIIQNNNDILKENEATTIINYQSKNCNFRKGPNLPKVSCQQFLPGIIKQDQITGMIGFLNTVTDPVRQLGMLKMMDDPKEVSTIRTPYGLLYELWRVQCVGNDTILINGDDKTIKQIDKTGCVLNTIHTYDNVWALTINSQMEPVFSLSNSRQTNTDVYIYKSGKVDILLSTLNWTPVGLYHSGNADLLVSMRSTDWTQSKVVRYSGATKIQTIQYDSQKQPLFSTGGKTVLPLTENGNGDICVADCSKMAVVVVDFSGRLRFMYTGNLLKQSKYTEFQPMHIAADANTQILINDNSNNILHIIDCDGNFVCYIDYACDGGLSIDIDHNLVIGNDKTGNIQIIKYLE
ncbi:tripartite motif-containing protein 2-like [Saccostrea cucullata]|uniref:tripartite motif-containing protein 2-like n=1 Tax=Saccostrea cuccullata TaxID=36930 RepID=UPI002ED2B647